MRLRLFVTGLSLLLLAGCASNAADLHYYLLHSPTQAAAKPQSASSYIRFNRITMPNYLKQRGLAMQTGPATVYFSATHVWAEPLASGLSQSLNASLWQEQQIDVVPEGVYQNRDLSSVTLHVDDFIATADNEVVLKGHYWLYPGKAEPRMKRFDFRRPLNQDGFAHAVVQMRKLVAGLAADIATNVSQYDASSESKTMPNQ
ncbi:membrane integrity-associated transporter subunit PqiC [Salinimonas marina]|uniref:Membrane integrity-associated transporter subunit PqiC n=1 Tax=Salinimonas marina TaxID=2785918 RepID=A0A7S9HCD4_9ALTE|nr:ABC-type transport auxiliary lipoprotein family protein [Salinimonas marina]QPG04762.1 membrane integrity-associated transporter subunit PqiC [Salinimonas marina]